MRVLAVDVGGTKTAVAIARVSGRSISFLRLKTYPSARWAGLEAILEDFLAAERVPPPAAAFGVAGPVFRGHAKVTKLPWSVDERRLSRHLGIRHVHVLNDFVAAALAIPLSSRAVATLVPGHAEREGPIGVLGAGTGLGQAVLVRTDSGWAALASEGGHVDFGPRNEREDRLVRFLRPRIGRVSRDRLLSGEGLAHIYDFVKSEKSCPERPALARALASGDRAAAISRFGLSGRDSRCRRALALFASIYGSEAGNLALQYRATGGVYLAGGIAPKILPALRGGGFQEAFRRKPPLEDLLARIPVWVVGDPHLGLIGAAATAYRTAMETTRRRSNRTSRPRPR